MGNNCQSCGMPMGNTTDMYGTEKDGSKSKDYCKYCYDKGEFASPNMTMNEMIDLCIPMIVKEEANMTEDSARNIMETMLPQLKRWKTA